MLTQSLFQKHSRQVPRERWTSFFNMFSDENASKPAAIQVVSGDDFKWDNLVYRPFREIRYNPYYFGTPLTIIFDDEPDAHSCVISSPKDIDVFYELNGRIFALVITDNVRKQTVIYVEDDVVVIPARPLNLRASSQKDFPLLPKNYAIEHFSI